jgi:predicted RNA-binding protein with TRAM domain
MARKTKTRKPKTKTPPLKRGPATEATVDEFQQEGMGIAAKE